MKFSLQSPVYWHSFIIFILHSFLYFFPNCTFLPFSHSSSYSLSLAKSGVWRSKPGALRSIASDPRAPCSPTHAHSLCHSLAHLSFFFHSEWGFFVVLSFSLFFFFGYQLGPLQNNCFSQNPMCKPNITGPCTYLHLQSFFPAFSHLFQLVPILLFMGLSCIYFTAVLVLGLGLPQFFTYSLKGVFIYLRSVYVNQL